MFGMCYTNSNYIMSHDRVFEKFGINIGFYQLFSHKYFFTYYFEVLKINKKTKIK